MPDVTLGLIRPKANPSDVCQLYVSSACICPDESHCDSTRRSQLSGASRAPAFRVLPSDEELAAEGATIQSLANDFLGLKEARTAMPPTWRVVKVGVDAGTCGVRCKATFDLQENDVDHPHDDATPPRNLSHLSHTLQWFRTQVRFESS